MLSIKKAIFQPESIESTNVSKLVLGIDRWR